MLSSVTRHHLGSIGACIDMAMATSLIAEFPNINLENSYSCRVEWMQTSLIQANVKRGMIAGLFEYFELFRRGGKGIVSSQQRQWHGYARTNIGWTFQEWMRCDVRDFTETKTDSGNRSSQQPKLSACPS